MHTSMKPFFLFSISFLAISTFLYIAQARPLPGCIMEVVSKESDSMVIRSFQRHSPSPPSPKPSPPSSPKIRSPPSTLVSTKPLLSSQVASS
ncbi:hypothetical protein MRB53_022153 [Persea americana]|uniref:Uncharacterized protein n=1 Tax=Persea americana TaxID=3435 RepID=A0ACC2L5X6_PERAE|nr:hypothetical protein MRB53_022153 [Persea americana]